MGPRGLPDGPMAVRGPIWWEPVLTPPLEPDRALGATGALSRVGVRLGSTMAQKPGRPACAPNSSTPGLLRSGKLTGSATDCVPSTMCRPRSPGAPDRRWRTRRTDPPRDSWHRSPWLAPPKPRGPGRTALGGHLGRRPGPSTRRRRSASLAPSVASPYFVGGLIEGEDNLSLQTPEQFLDRFRSTSGSTKSWLPLTGTSPTGVRRDGCSGRVMRGPASQRSRLNRTRTAQSRYES